MSAVSQFVGPFWANREKIAAVSKLVSSGRCAAPPQDAKLLYVVCTRALYRLTLVHAGGPAPLIGDANVYTVPFPAHRRARRELRPNRNDV